MQLAIIGGGISGLTCGWLLHDRHDLTVFETERQAGGHSNTVEFQLDGQQHRIDTGFIVYNDRTYPNFMELLRQLDIEVGRRRATDSVAWQEHADSGVEWNISDSGSQVGSAADFAAEGGRCEGELVPAEEFAKIDSGRQEGDLPRTELRQIKHVGVWIKR